MTIDHTIKLISLSDAARFLDVSRSTLYKWVERSFIPHIRIGKRIKFDPKALESWIASRTVEEAEA